MRALAFLLLAPALCLASDWKPLPGYDGLLYDAATVRREDQIVVAWVKEVGDKKARHTIEADCKRRALTEDFDTFDAAPDSGTEKAVNALCKRAWEVWK